MESKKGSVRCTASGQGIVPGGSVTTAFSRWRRMQGLAEQVKCQDTCAAVYARFMRALAGSIYSRGPFRFLLFQPSIAGHQKGFFLLRKIFLSNMPSSSCDDGQPKQAGAVVSLSIPTTADGWDKKFKDPPYEVSKESEEAYDSWLKQQAVGEAFGHEKRLTNKVVDFYIKHFEGRCIAATTGYLLANLIQDCRQMELC